MKFMVMHKHDANTEVGTPPPPELVQKMGALIGGMAQSGKLLDGEGLGAGGLSGDQGRERGAEDRERGGAAGQPAGQSPRRRIGPRVDVDIGRHLIRDRER